MPFTVKTFKKLWLRLNGDIGLRHTRVAIKCKKLLQPLVLRNLLLMNHIDYHLSLSQKYIAIHKTQVIQSVAIA